VNILIIGLGSIGNKHVSAILQVKPEAIIYALRSGKKFEVNETVRNIYSLKEIDFELDFIIISNPTQLHKQTIEQCLDFGCPLFIEKPVLSDLQDVDSLARKIKNKQIITYVACNMRFHPAIQFLKAQLKIIAPRLNEVNIYCGSYLPVWRPDRDFRTVYSAHSKMGGGVHLDLIHELDYCLWLFGKPAEIRSLKRNVSSLQIDSIDYAGFNLLYPLFTVNIILNYYRRDAKREIELITDENTFIIDLIKNKIYSNVSGKVLFEQPFDMSETYINQFWYFLDCIQGHQRSMNDFSEGIESLKIALNE
jgi:predicted dehydrogenase